MPERPTELRPGVSMFPVPDRGTALRDPAGRLVGVDLPPSAVTALEAWFGGGTRPDGLDEEIGAFEAAGFLHRPARPVALRIGVLGDGPLASAVTEALAGPAVSAAPARHVALLGDGDLPDAVCAVAEGPAPAAWTELDVLAERGIGWFRLSVEGRHGVLEPPAVGAGDVGHADVRARRLAAAGSGHAHLSAYWAAAGSARLSAGDRALLAALLAADVRAWAHEPAGAADGDLVPGALPARRRLRIVALDTAAVADHPVLPVPVNAP